MILDSLNNTKKIECLHPLFKKAFDYLKSTDFSKVEDGKHELDGSRLYVSRRKRIMSQICTAM